MSAKQGRLKEVVLTGEEAERFDAGMNASIGDREWFLAHPDRSFRIRPAATVEDEYFDQLEPGLRTRRGVFGRMRYFDLKRNWTKKVVPHLGDDTLNDILVTDFNKYTFGRWEIEFKRGDLPHRHESCDWDLWHRGPMPRFWQYTKQAACHWLVNFSLRLAGLVEPKRPWRIVTSDKHSTVWDGDETLFDFNYQAMGISPDECFNSADDEHLEPGQYMKVTFADPYRFDLLGQLIIHHRVDPEGAVRRLEEMSEEQRAKFEGLLVEYGQMKGWKAPDGFGMGGA